MISDRFLPRRGKYDKKKQETADGSYTLGFGQGSGCQVFPITILATKEQLLALQGNSKGLAFGYITLTEGVLNQIFTGFTKVIGSSFRGRKGTLEYPIDHRQNDQKKN